MKKAALFFSFFLLLSSCINAIQAQIHISINILPPEPFIERSPQPTTNHVWIEGEWTPQGNTYVRQPGFWTVPEKDHIWVKGEWVRNPDGSAYWQPGYWKPIPHVGVAMWIPEPEYLRPPRPSNQHLWVHGEWIWVNNHYMYQTGYWTVPEPNKVFINGHWAQWPNQEWYWVMGYWKRIPDNVFVASMPPDPAYNRPPQPSSEHIWVDGEWGWRNNGYAWQPGYWVVRDPHKRWVRGYWHQRQDGQFFWVNGYWDWI